MQEEKFRRYLKAFGSRENSLPRRPATLKLPPVLSNILNIGIVSLILFLGAHKHTKANFFDRLLGSKTYSECILEKMPAAKSQSDAVSISEKCRGLMTNQEKILYQNRDLSQKERCRVIHTFSRWIPMKRSYKIDRSRFYLMELETSRGDPIEAIIPKGQKLPQEVENWAKTQTEAIWGVCSSL